MYTSGQVVQRTIYDVIANRCLREQPLTVLFADIQDSTTMSERGQGTVVTPHAGGDGCAQRGVATLPGGCGAGVVASLAERARSGVGMHYEH